MEHKHSPLPVLNLIWKRGALSGGSESNLMNSHRKPFAPLRWEPMIERNPLYSVKLWPWAVFLIGDLREFFCNSGRILWRGSPLKKAVSPPWTRAGCGAKDDRNLFQRYIPFATPWSSPLVSPLRILSVCVCVCVCVPLCVQCIWASASSVCVCTCLCVHIWAGREGWERRAILIPLTLWWWPHCYANDHSVTDSVWRRAVLLTHKFSPSLTHTMTHKNPSTSIHLSIYLSIYLSMVPSFPFTMAQKQMR